MFIGTTPFRTEQFIRSKLLTAAYVAAASPIEFCAYILPLNVVLPQLTTTDATATAAAHNVSSFIIRRDRAAVRCASAKMGQLTD